LIFKEELTKDKKLYISTELMIFYYASIFTPSFFPVDNGDLNEKEKKTEIPLYPSVYIGIFESINDYDNVTSHDSYRKTVSSQKVVGDEKLFLCILLYLLLLLFFFLDHLHLLLLNQNFLIILQINTFHFLFPFFHIKKMMFASYIAIIIQWKGICW
jgi:hypothetical protein